MIYYVFSLVYKERVDGYWATSHCVVIAHLSYLFLQQPLHVL